MSKMKKLIAGVSALVIGATCATVASAEFKFAGYDTSVITQETFGNYRIGVVYQDVDPVTGYATGAVVSGETATLYGLEPTVAASFSAPLFELDYPNNEYVAVYAQNPETNAVEFTGKYLYNGENLNLQYRDVNYMWELAAPHRIYKRTQALINGAWFRNNTYPTGIYAGDVATVKAEYVNYYGFGDWIVIDANEDGAVNLADALYIYNIVSSGSGEYDASVDVDKDGVITLFDFIAVYKYLSGEFVYADMVNGGVKVAPQA